MKTTMRLRAFKDEAAAERAGMWALATLVGDRKAAAWCERKGIPIVKAASEGIGSAGGFLVPTEMVDAIVDRREAYGVFRQNAQPAPMSSDRSEWPASGTGATAYWTAEGVAITESQAALGMIGLTAQKLAALVKSSSELEEDSAVGFADWLADEMGRAFANKEDLAGFLGDGTSTYAGAVGVVPGLLAIAGAGKVTAASGHDTFAELDNADLASLIAVLPAAALPEAAWYISVFGFATAFCRLAGTAGGIVAMPDANGRVRPHFMGFPVQLTQVLPAVGTDLSGSIMLAFGDLRRAAMLGEAREFTLARSAAGATFATDQVAFKGTERVSINVHHLGDATTAGSIVGLVGE